MDSGGSNVSVVLMFLTVARPAFVRLRLIVLNLTVESTGAPLMAVTLGGAPALGISWARSGGVGCGEYGVLARWHLPTGLRSPLLPRLRQAGDGEVSTVTSGELSVILDTISQMSYKGASSQVSPWLRSDGLVGFSASSNAAGYRLTDSQPVLRFSILNALDCSP